MKLFKYEFKLYNIVATIVAIGLLVTVFISGRRGNPIIEAPIWVKVFCTVCLLIALAQILYLLYDGFKSDK